MKIEGRFSMRYTVVLEQEADGGYVATVPALPGCVSQGDTRDEVTRNIREAADLYIEDCLPLVTRSRLKREENTSSSPPAAPSETADGCFRPGTGQGAPAVGFVVNRQKGSHIVLRRANPYARVVVPDHKQIRPGTLARF